MTRPLRIITSGAQAAAIEALVPNWDRPVDITLGSSLGEAPDSIPSRLARGECFDLYFLAESGHRKYAAEGYLHPTFLPLVRSQIGAAVRKGAPVPDISTPEALRRTLLDAGSVAHAASASGIYLRAEVFPALGIEAEMATVARTIYSERVGRVVARGEAALGFQQMSELIPIPGITIVGNLPPEFGKTFIFGAAHHANMPLSQDAEDFLAYLQDKTGAEAFAASGLDAIR